MPRFIAWMMTIIGSLLTAFITVYVVFYNQIGMAMCFKCGRDYLDSTLVNFKEVMSTSSAVAFLGLVMLGYGIYFLRRVHA